MKLGNFSAGRSFGEAQVVECPTVDARAISYAC